MANNEVTFDIKQHLAILSDNKNGYRKEVSIVAWNGGVPKIDIRDWSEDHTRMTRGITLFEAEAEILAKALTEYFSKS